MRVYNENHYTDVDAQKKTVRNGRFDPHIPHNLNTA